MSDEDLLAIIAYMRTLAPIAHEDQPYDLDFPLGIIMNFIPQPLEVSVSNPATDPVSRGKYLATIAGCGDCHTPSVRGTPVEGEEWSGGTIINEHGFGTVVSTNLTPDAETGLNMTEAQWLAVFREGKTSDGRPLNAAMPWAFYKGMTDEDLSAIYAYLRTVPPVKKDTMAVLAEYAKQD
jgi:mono/diheme cytochrome c family protein